MSGEYSRGGYIPGPTVTVQTRRVGDRVEYWESSISAWVPVFTAAEVRKLGKAALENIERGGE